MTKQEKIDAVFTAAEAFYPLGKLRLEPFLRHEEDARYEAESGFATDSLDGEATDSTETADEEWMPKDDRAADWCMRKIKEAEDEYDKWKEFYTAQLESAKARKEHQIGYFTNALMKYFREVPKKETKTQLNYTLPSGKLVLTKSKLDYKRDDEALLAWAKANYPEFVKVEESVRWGDLKKTLEIVEGKVFVKETGETVGGVTAEETAASFKASPN